MLILLAAFSGVLLISRRGAGRQITEADFRRVREGMSRAEVEALLSPPTWTGPYARDLDGTLKIGSSYGTGEALWQNTEDGILVSYDEEGKVRSSVFLKAKERNAWQRLAHELGNAWSRIRP